MIQNKRRFFTGLAIATLAIVLDQLSKWWLLDVVGIASRPPMEVTGFFNLVMVWNYGISFGMFASNDARFVLIILSLIIVAVLLCWLMKSHDDATMLGIGLVIGGALANIIDRLRFGAVADFFDFHAFGTHWPAFNIADSAICIGVVVLCIQSIMHPPKKTQDKL